MNKKSWFTTKQIANGLKASIGSVTNNIKKLRKSSLINFRATSRKNQFEYKFKN
ncbi:hypothetical protein ISS05_01180 [Candidatus Woesearchaeota archaeon]|nr:hypothetical protein [Candidatus Woesearchaeota archaeon]